jgi:hypothetical protein
MSKRVITVAGIFLLSAPAMAAAKDTLEPRVQAMMACESISPREARLDCYDHSMVALKQVMAGGNMVLAEKKGPWALEGVVKASGQSGATRYWVVFENGDRWTINTAKTRRRAPQQGTTLKLKRTPLRNYWISGPDWSESEAEFVGHDSGSLGNGAGS